jgi:dTDP-4-amino-4,6-dideoxygalactose transaminase
MIRMVDLARRHAASPEVEARVLEVLRSGRYVGGPVVRDCELAAAARFGRAHAVGVASGTDALMLAFQAMSLGTGDEIVIPALSFFATAGAVVNVGATPVIVDVDDNGLLDADAVEAARGPRTRAVVPVHLFGAVAVPSTDLLVIDDAAQAVGAPGASLGALTAVSAYPTKTWGAAGDAGFVLGDDPAAIGRVRALGQHGMGEPHVHHPVGDTVGRNSRIDAIQAAVLLAQLDRLDERIARRQAIAARYDAALPDGAVPLRRADGHPVHHYVLRARDRDGLRTWLTEAGIETAVYYPRPLSRQPALATRARVTPCPNAERLCREMLALPADDSLTDAEVDRVIAALERG